MASEVRPLDVVFVLPSLDTGGAERVTVNLANASRRAGDRPHILLTDRRGTLVEELDPSIPVTALDHRRVRSALPGIIRHIRRRPPDVVVSTHTHVSLALCAARSLVPARTGLVIREPIHVPSVTREGSDYARAIRMRRIAQWSLYRRADLVLATSEPMLVDLRRLTGARVELLDNPVDVTGLREDVARAVAGRSTTTSSGRRFVSVGRLTAQKSLPDLLDAFAHGRDPTDRLVIVGEGPLRADIESLVQDLGLADHVELIGSRARPWEEIAVADALVLASIDEGMPNVVLEALAVGTPVIAIEELEVLRELQRAAPDGAVRLIPRALLADAIRTTVPRTDPLATRPTATLLPAAHAADVVRDRFRGLLLEVHRHRGTRVTSGS